MNTIAGKKISLIIPVYNEEANVASLYQELKTVLATLNRNYEIIFIDDGSTDSSLQILRRIFEDNPQVQVISLLGNQGQTLGLKAGFEASTGEIIVAMDGDGQHDPKYLPQFIQAIEEGNDIASGWKVKDAESGRFKFLLSRIAHKIVSKITGAKMNYLGATMKAYDRSLFGGLEISGHLHRFMGALMYYPGIKVKEIPIKIRRRSGGQSNYNLTKTLRVLLDLILIKFLTKYSKTPFVIFGSLGAIMGLFGTIGIFYVYLLKFFFQHSAAENVAGLIISAVCLITGLQFIFFGLLAEMVSRTYYTADRKRFFNVKLHLKH